MRVPRHRFGFITVFQGENREKGLACAALLAALRERIIAGLGRIIKNFTNNSTIQLYSCSFDF